MYIDVINEGTVILDELDEGLMRGLEVLVLHKKRILEAPKETSKSHICKTYNWFVSAGNEDIQGPKKWLGNNSIDEVQKTLKEDLHDWKERNMENNPIELIFL